MTTPSARALVFTRAVGLLVLAAALSACTKYDPVRDGAVWRQKLVEVVGDADRVTVEPHGVYALRGEGDPPADEPFVIEGAEAIGELVGALEFDGDQCGGVCECRGTHLLMFYCGEEWLAKMTYHHGTDLRGFWRGNARLTGDAQLALVDWFADHGYDGLRHTWEEQHSESE